MMALKSNKMYLSLFSILIYTFAGSWTPAPAEGARILAVETVGGKSHWNFMSAILRALVDNGHNVTVFTPFTDGNRENYTEVSTSTETMKFLDGELEDLMDQFGDLIKMMRQLPEMSRTLCDVVYQNTKMIEVFANRRSDFDVVLIEPLFSECTSYAAVKLNLPLIYVLPIPTMGIMERGFTGHMSNPAVVANNVASFGFPKTFSQRSANIAISIYATIVSKVKERILMYKEPREYDLYAPIPPSLVFVNRHFTVEPASSIPSNVVEIGGIHLKPAKKLTKDIIEFIEQSQHGVVYFTFGSTVRMSSLPKHIKKAFMDALAQIPQRVLWKYEDEIENKPKNLMIKKWLPQREILLHPNVKLLISHGGLSGLYEAIDGGVPILGFPLFGDQPKNIDNIVNAGMAISMDILSVTKDAFLKNVLELLNNKKYMENAKTASKIFKDRPISPANLVVYWTEYVIRHKGAPHLTSHAINLSWYQYYLLDLIALILVFIIVVFFVSYRIFKSISKYFSNYFRNTKSKSE
ncbi:UDP-glucuronosyltransferase 2C1-like [Acyrthosiphon pisum]|uniref:UDP-glucuronosyltransferase n=1 Tax=Acyrthosiphon pisum TaxID=7029 RepID=A0A8R2A3G9_ACYPI|nr:UDP-glucuronosyltransferase 2C1-like [Acyrthosiphon pisum]|eukprot:XP_001948228.2 PREDICTED: UDP-glucuronosyltransferase 2C1-like [Acyrthosiphon pisum]